MDKLPGFTSESSIFKSNNRYLTNYSFELMTNSISPALYKKPKGAKMGGKCAAESTDGGLKIFEGTYDCTASYCDCCGPKNKETGAQKCVRCQAIYDGDGNELGNTCRNRAIIPSSEISILDNIVGVFEEDVRHPLVSNFGHHRSTLYNFIH